VSNILTETCKADASEPTMTMADLEAVEEVEHLRRQISPLREDLDMLRDPIHPIRRCPTDILQCIFEWVVFQSDSTDEWEKIATNLSQISYRWRQVVTSTSRFWRYPKFSLKKGGLNQPDDFEAYWTRLLGRIRTCKAAIHIKDIDNDDDIWERLDKCRLDLLPNVRYLRLWINSRAGAERLATDERFHPPTCSLETFQIERNWSRFISYSLVLDPGRVLSRFSTITKVFLQDFDFSNFTTSAIFPNTPHLVVERSTNLPLNLLAQVFPNLEKLILFRTEFRGHTEGTISWPELDLLVAYSTNGIPWHRLKLPKLTQLIIPEITSNDGLMDFIPSHPSIRHLHSPKLLGCYSSMAKCAPQMLCLSMPASEASAVLQFPNIVSLRLFQFSTDDLSCELFEEIVRKYFLPSRQFTKEEKQTALDARHPTCLFKICVPTSGDFEVRWKESPLLAKAVEGSIEQSLWLTKYRTTHFKWE
jgi:hypothetical protein